MNLWKTTIADRLAILMPIASAILAVGAGSLMLMKHEDCAVAIAGIIAGLTSAIGVVATGKASYIRDDQMRFWMGMAADAQTRTRDGFGN
jgi:hypothetical protein